MRNRHTFTFEGGEQLTTMGAAWFVSYCYYDKIDKTHRNWEKIGTHDNRKSVYNRTAQYYRLWLMKVLEMSTDRLSTNKIGLTGEKVKKMAQELLNMQET